MNLWRSIALIAFFATAPALAQAVPEPAPLPQFHMPSISADEAAAAPAEDAGAPAEDPGSSAVVPPPTQITAAPDDSAAKAIAKATSKPQAVTLTALVTDGGAAISDGVVWRVFDAKPDASGKLALAEKSEDAVAKMQLAPGTYVVHVAYGRAQASETIEVAEGANTATMVLDAGGLRLNAAISGDVPIPINLLHFDVFTAGATDADRQLIAQDMAANDIVTLNAGTYHIVSYFGDVNAVVRADLKVEPGQLTDAILYHKAAQISLKLVSEAGGEAIADVDWTVKTTDGTTVFTNTGAFPSAVLEEGTYLVLAKLGEKVFNRNFAVTPGQPKEIEVLTTIY